MGFKVDVWSFLVRVRSADSFPSTPENISSIANIRPRERSVDNPHHARGLS